jgi:uncharacterized protein YyaL (SSP411 family)
VPNRLALETSPYLLQHAENPVDWYPWGAEAFAKALAEEKPVFLSVGYSACHWCHVMEHESFEDEATAALMNEHFVSVKVDREERPDVDAIYMEAVQTLTGGGGWPMSVFLTPDAVPFYGGTYFPDKARYGMPSFTDLLTQIAVLWETRRDEVLSAGSNLAEELRRQASAEHTVGHDPLDAQTLRAAMRALSRGFDRHNGGWGEAPKFPQPAVVEFLLRRHLATEDERPLQMAMQTLDAMMRGGIYDQLGGGFHRYATDEAWLVPHFEKMLYDNAQLARLYLHGWQVTGNLAYRRVAEETLDYVAREMLDASGGFYSAQDADSEGEEGRFFVWTPDQMRAELRDAGDVSHDDAELFMLAYGVSAGGNFEGKSILHVVRTATEIAEDRSIDVEATEARLAYARGTLLAARERRVKPGLDDKVLAGWNGLMLGAFAEAARVLGRNDYREIAEHNAEFLLTSMRSDDGRMLRTWKAGCAKLNGYLEDYANVADGLLELYQTTFDPRWFAAAHELAEAILAHFADENGGFFDTSDDHETLLVRPKGVQDGAVPCGSSVAAGVLKRLAHFTGDARYADASEAAISPRRCGMEQAPLGFAYWLSVLDFMLSPPQELALVGDDLRPLLEVVRADYRPNLVVAAGKADAESTIELLRDRGARDGRATGYLCRQSACQAPVTGADELRELLDA